MRKNRYYYVMVTMGVASCMWHALMCQELQLFDRPFPLSLYEQIVDMAMLVWEDVKSFNENRSGLDRDTWQDLMVGRLIRLQGYCNEFVQKGALLFLAKEDHAYLIDRVSHMGMHYKGSYPYIKNLITQIEKMIAGH